MEENFGALKTDVIQVEKVDWQNEQDGIKFGKLVRTATESEELGPGVLLGAGKSSFIANKIYTAPLALE